jgi:hypothetical protein
MNANTESYSKSDNHTHSQAQSQSYNLSSGHSHNQSLSPPLSLPVSQPGGAGLGPLGGGGTVPMGIAHNGDFFGKKDFYLNGILLLE